ncbi:hypothetical protein EmuJ_000710500 [Echinococcus multilocularis]|uniref:Uncharacterized protein n=1 Tax=Echinococcus multilocularis TaxID=6211 RepID=A0A068Y4Y1_ECHMU|nr:hypothetical protein EmuJ_000710500 [Echinococcus multilocularis]
MRCELITYLCVHTEGPTTSRILIHNLLRRNQVDVCCPSLVAKMQPFTSMLAYLSRLLLTRHPLSSLSLVSGALFPNETTWLRYFPCLSNLTVVKRTSSRTINDTILTPDTCFYTALTSFAVFQ